MRSIAYSILIAVASAVTIFMCGDSTMADPVTKGTSKELARVGWGASFAARMSLKVVNLAQVGASVRSFDNAGLFGQIIDEIGPSDWMICQFGHNELGGYHTSDKAALPGIGSDTKEIINNLGQRELIRSFGGAFSQAQAKGAHVMILSQTPEVQYSSLAVTARGSTRFVQYSHDLANLLPDIKYYDHYQALADYLQLCGERKSASFFLDNRHMNKLGAQHAAELFLQWLRESDSDLRNYIRGEDNDENTKNKRAYHILTDRTRGHRRRWISPY